MATKKHRLVTEVCDPAVTANMIEAGLHKAIETAGDASPLAALTVKQVAWASALVMYALGEVYERQFYPSDRDECQEVARMLLSRIGIPVPNRTILPGGR